MMFIKQKIKFIAFLIPVFFFLFSTSVCLAADPQGFIPEPKGYVSQKLDKCKPGGDVNCGNYTLEDFISIFLIIAEYGLGIVGALALLFFIYGGVVLLISAGNQEMVTKGKSVLVNSVIGLMLVFGSALIIGTILDGIGYNKGGEFKPWSKAPEAQVAPAGSGGGTSGLGVGTITSDEVTAMYAALSITEKGKALVAAAKMRSEPLSFLMERGVVEVSATSNCYTVNFGCTNVAGLKSPVKTGLVDMIKGCSAMNNNTVCQTIITGAAESGGYNNSVKVYHSTTGTCTHIGGCKIDLAKTTPKLSNYIRTKDKQKGTRNGDKRYQIGSLCCVEEGTHFDCGAMICPAEST